MTLVLLIKAGSGSNYTIQIQVKCKISSIVSIRCMEKRRRKKNIQMVILIGKKNLLQRSVNTVTKNFVITLLENINQCPFTFVKLEYKTDIQNLRDNISN